MDYPLSDTVLHPWRMPRNIWQNSPGSHIIVEVVRLGKQECPTAKEYSSLKASGPRLLTNRNFAHILTPLLLLASVALNKPGNGRHLGRFL
jgi:hypothetical protein